MSEMNSAQLEKEILDVVKNSKFGVTASEVAKILGIHRNTARFYLLLLEKTGEIIGVNKGRVVIYFPKEGAEG